MRLGLGLALLYVRGVGGRGLGLGRIIVSGRVVTLTIELGSDGANPVQVGRQLITMNVLVESLLLLDGLIIFRRFGNIVHPIQWCARKLRRVACSSSTAEVLAAAKSMSDGLYIQTLISELNLDPRAELTIDSTSLLALSTSIKEPEERYNKVDLASIREAYDDGALSAVMWCPGQKLPADALTKANPVTAEFLLVALASGNHTRPSEMVANLGHSSIRAFTLK